MGTVHLRRLFFGDYLAEMDEAGERPYCEILDPEVRQHSLRSTYCHSNICHTENTCVESDSVSCATACSQQSY